MVPEVEPAAIFVYGTLKRGEINHALLAPHAASIEPAWVRGSLYDVGEFPALSRGDGRVSGELVVIRPPRLARVLALLDALEQFHSDDPSGSLYIRETVTAELPTGASAMAHAYFYNDEHPALPPLPMLRAVPSGRWSGAETGCGIHFGALGAFRDHVRSFRRQD